MVLEKGDLYLLREALLLLSRQEHAKKEIDRQKISDIYGLMVQVKNEIEDIEASEEHEKFMIEWGE